MEGTEDSSETRSHCCNTVFVKVLLSINRKMKVNPSILYVQVYYLIIGLSEIFQTPLLHLRKIYLRKSYCLPEQYHIALRLFLLIVPSSLVITNSAWGFYVCSD